METKSYTTIDRASWPSGPWDNEPDKMQWPDAASGFPCLAVRNSRSGHWCGYVGVAPGHPYYQKDYDSVDADVHGGLTFANTSHPSETESKGVCHVPAPGDSDHVWWFGFDCAHSNDYSPTDLLRANTLGYPFTISPEQKYRTLRYVQNQCACLAKQLAESSLRMSPVEDIATTIAASVRAKGWGSAAIGNCVAICTPFGNTFCRLYCQDGEQAIRINEMMREPAESVF